MDKINKANHKTLFLLDFTANFTNKSSEQPIEFDVFTKNRSSQTGANIIPLPAICKSLWSCTVESVLEYSRIVWDLFPGKRESEIKLVPIKILDNLFLFSNSIQNQINYCHF